MKVRKIDTVTVQDVARAIFPKEWAESDRCESQGMTPDFDTNLKCVQSLTFAKKALDYLRD